MWHFNDKNGFTLIEVMIVVMIVGVLSTLAVTGYSSFRKNALIELSADNIVSQISQLRSKTVAGDFGSERAELVKEAIQNGDEIVAELDVGEAKCLGMVFEKNGDGFVAKSFVEDFEGKQVFVVDRWEYRGCEDLDLDNARDIELDKQIVIEEISLLDEAGVEDKVFDNFVMRFLPPSGELEIAYDAFPFFRDFSEKTQVKLRIRYGEGEGIKRDIVLDLNSLKST